MKTRTSVFLITLFHSLSIVTVTAQQTDTSKFIPHGKPVVTIFTNFHAGFVGSELNHASFNLTRGYFGYVFYMHPNFTATVKLDVGSPEDLFPESHIRRYAYFKNANIVYHTKRFSWGFGLLTTRMFKLSEKYWNHRYIEKPYLDQYRFGPSADLGTIVSYAILPFLSADLSVTNGEGYTSLQKDTTFRTGLGVTWKISDKVILRGYGDIYHKKVNKSVMSLFAGYKSDKLIAGGEFDYYLHAGNALYKDRWGFSGNVSWYFAPHFQVFGRYDLVTSTVPPGENTGWLEENDGTVIITGIEFSPIKYLKIAANYRHWSARNDYADLNWFYVNLKISF